MLFVSMLKEILSERYVNATSIEDKRKYANEVWKLLTKAYEDIGGFKTADSPEELIEKSSLWKMVRRDGRIVAVAVYRDQYGRKSIAGAAEVGPDGKATKAGKDGLMSIVIEDIKMKRSWSEVSGKMEHLKLKHGIVPIPNKYAPILTKKEIISYNPDGYHYTRMIGGKPYEKMMVGYLENFDTDSLVN